MPIVVPVRFRYATIDPWFDPVGLPVHRGDHVVVNTERGTEIGLAVEDPFNVNEETLRAPLKDVIRIATEEDLVRANELSQEAEIAFEQFKETVEKTDLAMKPVACEYLFDGDKIVCYFAADERVDFRELVRDLASIYRMRVDMRQIGVRDQARLVGGFGHCGQELCCKRFGREFEPVSIRMAKEQDLPLNPSKISGACGRLMCCLRYEFDAYKDFKTRAPKRNALIETPLGTAKVVDFNTPLESVTLLLENGKQFVVPLKKMCCKEGDGSCVNCAAQGAQNAGDEKQKPKRPDAVTREALNQIDDTNLQLLLSQLDTELAVQELAEAQEEAYTQEQPQRTRRRRTTSQDSNKQDEGGSRKSTRSRRIKRTRPQADKKDDGGKQDKQAQQDKPRSSRKRRKPVQANQPKDKQEQGGSSRRVRRQHKPDEGGQKKLQPRKRTRRPGDGGGNKNQSQNQGQNQGQGQKDAQKKSSSRRRRKPSQEK